VPGAEPGVVVCPAVLVILPPSEGKTAPVRGKPVDLERLVHPELNARREALLDALDPGLRAAPAARASRVYTGVLFQRLRLGELRTSARRRVLIASALWGVVAPDDRIPAYKLPIGTRLDGFGGLAAHWRPALQAALPDGGLVVDLRSGAYATAWRPGAATVVGVRGFVERGGRRSVVSHMVKATRGEVARLVLEAPRAPRSAEAVAAIVAAAGHEVELTRAAAGWSLDVIDRA
jgi:cytoplasmic iron level regulating protein YaaA (DUF328/UPF0246 family)